MQVQWKKLVAKIVIWLASEILLTFLEIDHLADYSEFIFDPFGEFKIQNEKTNNFELFVTRRGWF